MPPPAHPLELRVPPPLAGLVTAAAMVLIARWLPAFEIAVPGRDAIVVVLIGLGLTLDFTALTSFLRRRTTINPLKPQATSALVTTGVYRLTRNPMYLGLATLLLAWAAWLGNTASLAGLALFVLWIDRFQIRPEERALEERFGEAFRAYRRRVRRWI